MKILFTGGSSFTGYWFIKELASCGHEVVAIFRHSVDEYPDLLRRVRVRALIEVCRPVFGVSFGDDQFLDLIKGETWDLFCHHAAEVSDYKSPDFNVMAAVARNTHRLTEVLDRLQQSGCNKVIVTGSIFENDEGWGSDVREAFSPYGLSKGLTWQIFRYYARARRMTLGKFVIPNPFGPCEEPRFTSYLITNWSAGLTPIVNTPAYVRDNIHVSLLAKSYRFFAQNLMGNAGRINPSGYVETQGEFTARLAAAMRQRLALKCEFTLAEQTEFSEPRVRVNTDRLDAAGLGWDEETAWDQLADYYKQLLVGGP